MKKYDTSANQEVISKFTVEMMKDEKDGEEFTREYLRSKFLSSVGRSLYYARQKAGLTQEQVAERMNTKQPAIARLETDLNGSMSFRTYADFAIACGMVPRSLMIESILEPIKSLRDEMIALAEIQQSQQTQNAMSHANLELEPASFATMISASTVQSDILKFTLANLRTTHQESTPTANSVDRYLKDYRYQSQSTAS